MVSMSRATEDYLKAVYHVAHRGRPVTTGLLATELGVSSPSVSAMVRRLEEGGLLERCDNRSFRLTGPGERPRKKKDEDPPRGGRAFELREQGSNLRQQH